MKLFWLVGAAALVAVTVCVLHAESGARAAERRKEKAMAEDGEKRVRMTFGKRVVVVRLRDHAMANELWSRLPLTLSFKDYIGKEKIAYLPKKLSAKETAVERGRGDFAYYAPWGNLAVFYNDTASHGGGLVILGTIESGKNHLAAMDDDFTAVLEKMETPKKK